jgi:two-component system response regulator MprA/two-component system response regulator TrcR
MLRAEEQVCSRALRTTHGAKWDWEADVKPGTRVLVIEDDRSIAQLVELELEERNLTVQCRHDGISGLEAVTEFEPAVILLDIMLPGMDGVGVLKRIRQRGNRVPVIMLTARGEPPDKVHSLDLGADDYVTKPFDVEELLARLRALVRRAEGDEEILRVADLEINTATREVRRGTRKIALTAREYELLRFMAQNPRRVLSRELLLSRVWGYGSNVGTANVVEVYVGYLRKKVDVPREPRLIHTVRGAGYALREE